MAISVPIPKEITEYEEKIMFGLSLRKLVCFSSAVVLGVGTYFLCTKVLGLTMDTASYIIIAEAMDQLRKSQEKPAFLVGLPEPLLLPAQRVYLRLTIEGLSQAL